MGKLQHQLIWTWFSVVKASRLVIRIMSIKIIVHHEFSTQRSWFRSAHSSEHMYKATAPNVSYYDASTVNVQSNPTMKSWMVCLAYLGRDLWEVLYEFRKLNIMNGYEWTIWWHVEFCQAPEADAAMEARDQLTEEIHRDIFKTFQHHEKIIENWFALWAWKLGQVGWKKQPTSARSELYKLFHLASCWTSCVDS